MLTGCSAIKESVNDFIEHDANIGKNAPAVMGTIADIDALNEEAARSEAAEMSAEERAQKAADEERVKLEEKAHDILSEMTPEEKIGQLLLARMPEAPAETMAEYQLGGYTLYADDFKDRDPETLSALTEEIAAAADISPFIAVDEEGGKVVRVSKFTQYREEPFSSPQLLYQRGGTELLEIDSKEKAKLLKSLGINFNLAPVADISTDESSYIYPRTMGQGAEGTAEGVAAIVRTFNSENVASCLKHFPGYGENTDTHSGASHDSRELYEFYNRDFVPFEAGIEADMDKTPAVMVGHTVYDLIDPDVPASLSETIHNALREKLRFDGVIITDDLGMDAIAEYSSDSSVYVLGVLAGNDMLCVSDYEAAYSDILAAYESGTVTDEMLDERVVRILIMKQQYGILGD